MEFKKFCEERDRMCEYYTRKDQFGYCPIRQRIDYCCECGNYCLDNPLNAESLISEWIIKHPAPTLLSAVMEKFPSIALNEKGVPRVCPHHLCDAWFHPENGGCVFTSGSNPELDCVACWTRPIPDDEE